MARVRVVVPHQLPPDEAQSRVRAFLDSPDVRSRLDTSEVRWSGRNADLRGESFSGTIYVNARDVEVDLELHGFLGMFAGSAESELKRRLAEALV